MKAIFDYSDSLPEYMAHSGQTVEVVELAGPGLEPGERIHLIRADDGWEGYAFNDELTPIEEAK